MRIIRLANFVAPHSGGLRTSLAELGAGYLAAGHEPVLVIPGDRDDDELAAQRPGDHAARTAGAVYRRIPGAVAQAALACGTPAVTSAESALPEVRGRRRGK